MQPEPSLGAVAASSSALKVALVGIGKIARDQHLPAIAASPQWELAATVSPEGGVEGVEGYSRLEDMLSARPDICVVSLCLPPGPRFAVAEAALRANRHVMLEKPPSMTLSQVARLQALAQDRGVTLYASWHARAAQAVAAAKRRLRGGTVLSGKIMWREDVRQWHPGQDWIFAAGGMGVFDPGINALSILTEILPRPVYLQAADLAFPANRQAPIAARLRLSQDIVADFDFRQEGVQTWDIELATDFGFLALRKGGNSLEINGEPVHGDMEITGEYPALYGHLAELVRMGRCDVDITPMVLVADAFLCGTRSTVETFHF